MNATVLPPRRMSVADLPQPGYDRTFSFAQMMIMEKYCPYALQCFRENKPKVRKNKFQSVGDTTHKAAKIRPGEDRDRFVRDAIQRMPVADREKSEQVIKDCLANDAKLDNVPVAHRQVDRRLFRCQGPLWPWELVAKPDESGEIKDPKDDRLVYRLVEKKTAWIVKPETRRQIFFAGMVASLDPRLRYSGSIMMVVRLLRAGRDSAPYWYSRKGTDHQMLEIVPYLTAIEGWLAKGGDFPAHPGHYCGNCPWRQNCDAYQASKFCPKEPDLVQLTVNGQPVQPLVPAAGVGDGAQPEKVETPKRYQLPMVS